MIKNGDQIILKGSVTSGLSDEEFLRFCLDNPDLRIERNNKLEIIIMSPDTGVSGLYHAEIVAQLRNWNHLSGKGYVFDSSTAFSLPDRSVLSPDAAWLSADKWEKLMPDDKDRFPPVAPDFVIEIVSKSDSLDELKEKMKLWLKNGVELGWLIDPRDKKVYVFNIRLADISEQSLNAPVMGTSPVEGFVLDLSSMRI
ncbi:MAG: Uma2 family endonuclease [Cyclobacteriaceae bacterium]|nr:Uma2 family endonuclease [Cyclobacteriaceae bacterium]MCX7638121.1 Uma2 family endonuclease [Cyclobacteriaceae bacterium]MDW8331085.1 Uma2 family endonuclease [Cyclobacteriaceae bacterium]